MQTLSTALALHLQQPLTTLATCVRMARTDGVVLAFTDHDQPLLVGGVLYQPEPGFAPMRVQQLLDSAPDKLALEGSLRSEAVREEDIALGRFDGAVVTVSLVNHQSVSDGALVVKQGSIVSITQQGESFLAEVRGLSHALNRTITQRFSPTCRAQFGDAQCGISRSAYQVSGTLSGMFGTDVVLDAARTEAENLFAGGTIRFTSGTLDGLEFLVRGNSAGKITLFLPLAVLPTNGTSYVLTRGCDKSFATCQSVYNNAINFRGEPHLPGIDRLLQAGRG